MSTSLMYHTQGIKGFQHVSYKYEQDKVIQRIERNEFYCSECGSYNITLNSPHVRRIQGVPTGRKNLFFELEVHIVYCKDCKGRKTEELDFLPNPKARITRLLERSIVELRPHMSITAISKFFDLDWRLVKDCEKAALHKKYAHVSLKDVRVIGIDEIFVSRRKDKEQYITVVRDLETGAVLYVGKGKGLDAMDAFNSSLKHSKAKIETVTMDMSKAYISWAQENLPDARIVFDHFHLIKMMNEKLDNVRRRTAASLDEDHRKLLKNQRFLFLRNVEKLEPDAKQLLDNLRKVFKDLGDTSMMKEALRSIYKEADNEFQAEAALKNWCSIARQTEVKELGDMASCIENHLNGILAYWSYNGLSNSSMEGFNNKIRWLIRQAYGYHDEEYFHLKIFDLPKIDIKLKL